MLDKASNKETDQTRRQLIMVPEGTILVFWLTLGGVALTFAIAFFVIIGKFVTKWIHKTGREKQ
jgi:hypothetical protein